jgi:hypothetical protein
MKVKRWLDSRLVMLRLINRTLMMVREIRSTREVKVMETWSSITIKIAVLIRAL